MNDLKIEMIIEEASKLGVKNGIKTSILLIKQIKLIDSNITIDEIIDILEKTLKELGE